MKNIEKNQRAGNTKLYSSPTMSDMSIGIQKCIASSTEAMTSDYDEVTYEGTGSWI